MPKAIRQSRNALVLAIVSSLCLYIALQPTACWHTSCEGSCATHAAQARATSVGCQGNLRMSTTALYENIDKSKLGIWSMNWSLGAAGAQSGSAASMATTQSLMAGTTACNVNTNRSVEQMFVLVSKLAHGRSGRLQGPQMIRAIKALGKVAMHKPCAGLILLGCA